MKRHLYTQPFECLLLYHTLFRKLHNEKDERVCVSEDGIIGVGKPGGACRYCPNADFENENRCKVYRKLFILRTGNSEPEIFIVPPTSVNAFNASVKRWLSGDRVNKKRIMRISKGENGRFVFENMLCETDEHYPPESKEMSERIVGEHTAECAALARRIICTDTE